MPEILGVKGIDANIGTLTFKYLYGSQWLLVFHQNITNENYFRDDDEVVNCSAPDKYFNDTMKISEKFEFLLKYDTNENKYNWWKQSNNPIGQIREEILKLGSNIYNNIKNCLFCKQDIVS